MLEVIILNYKPLSKILLITIGFLIVMSYFFFNNIRDHILENWTHYRQHPMFLPFAGLFKRDKGESVGEATKKNFIKVLWNIVNKFLSILMTPIYPILNMVLYVMKAFSGIINGIRNQINVIRNFLFKLFEKMYIRLQNGIATIIFFFLKLRETMKRSYGLMTLVLYSIEHAYMFFESMMKSPLGKFGNIAEVGGLMTSIFTFGGFGIPVWHSALCFDENTKIELNTGQFVKIGDLKLGQELVRNIRILAIIKMKNSLGIYNYNGIDVKGDHLVRYNNSWVRVKDVPDAIENKNYKGNIVCLLTENGIIRIGNEVFKDYSDTHSKIINSTVRKMVNDRLNGSDTKYKVGCDDLIAGFSPKSARNNNYKGKVLIEKGTLNVYSYKGNELSGNILVLENGNWIRVADSLDSKYIGRNTEPFINYITPTNTITLNDGSLIRDFLEVSNKKFNDNLDTLVDKLTELYEN